MFTFRPVFPLLSKRACAPATTGQRDGFGVHDEEALHHTSARDGSAGATMWTRTESQVPKLPLSTG